MIEGILIAAVVLWLGYRFASGTRCPSCHKLAAMRKSGETRIEVDGMMKRKKQNEYACRGCGHTEWHNPGFALGAMFMMSAGGWGDGGHGGDGGDGGGGCGGCGGA